MTYSSSLPPATAAGEPWTPGPWRVLKDGVTIHSVKGWCKSFICRAAEVYGNRREREANARMISAAPDLYAALKWFIDDIDGTHTVMTEFDDAVALARAALSAARSYGAHPEPHPVPAKDEGGRP